MTYSYTISKLLYLALTLICCYSLELYNYEDVKYEIFWISDGNDICGSRQSLKKPIDIINLYGRKVGSYQVNNYSVNVVSVI